MLTEEDLEKYQEEDRDIFEERVRANVDFFYEYTKQPHCSILPAALAIIMISIFICRDVFLDLYFLSYLFWIELVFLIWTDPAGLDNLAPRSKRFLTVAIICTKAGIYLTKPDRLLDGIILFLLAAGLLFASYRYNSIWLEEYRFVLSQLQRIALVNNDKDTYSNAECFRAWAFWGKRECISMFQEFLSIKIGIEEERICKHAWLLGFLMAECEYKKQAIKAEQAIIRLEEEKESNQTAQSENQELLKRVKMLEEETREWEEDYRELEQKIEEENSHNRFLSEQLKKFQLKTRQEAEREQIIPSDEEIYEMIKTQNKSYAEVLELYPALERKENINNALKRYKRKIQ